MAEAQTEATVTRMMIIMMTITTTDIIINYIQRGLSGPFYIYSNCKKNVKIS
jgi:hypothetical protein